MPRAPFPPCARRSSPDGDASTPPNSAVKFRDCRQKKYGSRVCFGTTVSERDVRAGNQVAVAALVEALLIDRHDRRGKTIDLPELPFDRGPRAVERARGVGPGEMADAAAARRTRAPVARAGRRASSRSRRTPSADRACRETAPPGSRPSWRTRARPAPERRTPATSRGGRSRSA